MKTPSWFLKRNFTALILTPLSVLYLLCFELVFVCRDFLQKLSKTPANRTKIICVGGILAGGVGKTPIVREIAGKLRANIVMRGYGSGIMTQSKKVRTCDTAADVGDEPKMLAARGFDVFVGKNRRKTVQIAQESGNNPVIMDDGFQNPTVRKDIAILVFDEHVGLGNGFMLPAGPLREPLRLGLARADAIVIVKSGTSKSNVASLIARRSPHLPIFFATNKMTNPGLSGKVIAFAGLGYPEKFFNGVRKMPQIRVIDTVPFPDHHRYTQTDLVELFRCAKNHGAKLVCTEKDWIKLPENIREQIKFIPLDITIQPKFFKWMKKGELNENIRP